MSEEFDITILLESGGVQQVCTEEEELSDLQIRVVDFDVDGVEDEMLYKFNGKRALVTMEDINYCPKSESHVTPMIVSEPIIDKSRRIVLTRVGGYHPWSTHIQKMSTEEYVYGHYFDNFRRAMKDFFKRCEEHGVSPNPSRINSFDPEDTGSEAEEIQEGKEWHLEMLYSGGTPPLMACDSETGKYLCALAIFGDGYYRSYNDSRAFLAEDGYDPDQNGCEWDKHGALIMDRQF